MKQETTSEIKFGRIYSYGKSTKDPLYVVPIRLLNETVEIYPLGREKPGYILKGGFIKHYRLVEQCPM